MLNNLAKKPRVNIVLPAYNEEVIIAENIILLHDFLKIHGEDYWWRIIVVDNMSTDRTRETVEGLAVKYSEIKYLYLPNKGKGLAIRRGWESAPADVYVFMDSDLSTGLTRLPELINGVLTGADIAIGSRWIKGSRVERSRARIFISHVYNFILNMTLGLKVHDAPCGFKAVNPRVVKEILPRVQSNQWFFDTELLVLASKNGYKIQEIPVSWVEHARRKTKVSFSRVVFEYLREIYRLKRRLSGCK